MESSLRSLSAEQLPAKAFHPGTAGDESQGSPEAILFEAMIERPDVHYVDALGSALWAAVNDASEVKSDRKGDRLCVRFAEAQTNAGRIIDALNEILVSGGGEPEAPLTRSEVEIWARRVAADWGLPLVMVNDGAARPGPSAGLTRQLGREHARFLFRAAPFSSALRPPTRTFRRRGRAPRGRTNQRRGSKLCPASSGGGDPPGEGEGESDPSGARPASGGGVVPATCADTRHSLAAERALVEQRRGGEC